MLKRAIDEAQWSGWSEFFGLRTEEQTYGLFPTVLFALLANR